MEGFYYTQDDDNCVIYVPVLWLL